MARRGRPAPEEAGDLAAPPARRALTARPANSPATAVVAMARARKIVAGAAPRALQYALGIAAAGMRRIGLGVLLGLAHWREETLALAEHGAFLMKHFSRAQISFSFPRLRPAQDVESQQFQHLLGDRDLVQMMLALRLCFADAGLVLSTREPAALRDALVKLGVTKMSAGSKTNPGGYGEGISSLEQFSVDDQRSADEVAAMIRSQGFESVWKDWDAAFAAVGG